MVIVSKVVFIKDEARAFIDGVEIENVMEVSVESTASLATQATSAEVTLVFRPDEIVFQSGPPDTSPTTVSSSWSTAEVLGITEEE